MITNGNIEISLTDRTEENTIKCVMKETVLTSDISDDFIKLCFVGD